MTDASGPYIRCEVTIAAAIVKRDDTILNDDMLDTTLVFGRPLADGPAIDAGLVTTERSQAAIAQVLADLAQAVQVFINQHYAFLGELEGEGRGMIDDIRETGETREVIGTAAFRTVSAERGQAGLAGPGHHADGWVLARRQDAEDGAAREFSALVDEARANHVRWEHTAELLEECLRPLCIGAKVLLWPDPDAPRLSALASPRATTR